MGAARPPTGAASLSPGPGRATAQDADFQASDDVRRPEPPDLRGFPAERARPRVVAFLSPGGSQGGALAAQALQNAEAGGYQVRLHTRDVHGFRRNALVHCGEHWLGTALHPRATVSSGTLDIDPADSLVFDATPVFGLSDTIARTPTGSSVVYAQNGLPSHTAQKQARALDPHVLVSMVTTTRAPGVGVTVVPGGTMLADEDDPLIDTLHTVLRDRGFFQFKAVPHIEGVRYEKIALNSALNVTATLFGETLGGLLQRMYRDSRLEKLVGGLAAEVCAVAVAQGIRMRPDDQVIANVHAAMARFPAHPTSMRAAFDAGGPTEIDVLNAGISRLGARLGVPTPLNERVTEALARYEAARGDVDMPAGDGGFHVRHAALVRETTEGLLDAAARLG